MKMARPHKQNPKNKHIGIVTTEEKFRRFKALGLVGDEAIDVLLYHLESDNMKLNIQKSQAINNIKKLRKQIEDLEYEILKEETKIEQINEKIGLSKETGLRKDVDKAIKHVLQRFNSQEIYTIEEFFSLKKNQNLIESQAMMCSCDIEEFKDLVRSNL